LNVNPARVGQRSRNGNRRGRLKEKNKEGTGRGQKSSKGSRRAKEGGGKNTERQGMGDRGWSSTKGEKDICTRRGT